MTATMSNEVLAEVARLKAAAARAARVDEELAQALADADRVVAEDERTAAAAAYLHRTGAAWLLRYRADESRDYGPRLIGPAHVWAVRFEVPGHCPIRLLVARCRNGQWRTADWAMSWPCFEEKLGECLWEVEARGGARSAGSLGDALVLAGDDIPF